MTRYRFETFRDSANFLAKTHDNLRRHVKSGFCRVQLPQKRDGSGFLIRAQKSSRPPTADERKALLREFLPSDAPFLATNNLKARLNFMRIWNRQCLCFAGRQQTYLVTFTISEFAMSLEHAKRFDLKIIHRRVRKALKHFSFIGNIEVAPYTNWQFQLQRGNIYHLHVHAIVFGGDEEELARRIASVNREHVSIVPGCPAAHYEPIKSGTLQRVLLYIMKAPTFRYRASPMKTRKFDVRTNRYVKSPTGTYSNKPDPARPGVQLKVREIMAGWHLDRVIFGGGDGRVLVKSIKEEALAPLPPYMRSRRQAKFSGVFKKRASENL